MNGGDDEVYIGSGDLMERNLDRRVEVITPLNDTAIKRHMRDVVLETLLSDTHRSWELRTDGTYRRIHEAEGVEPLNSQQYLLDWYSKHTLLED